MTGLSILLDVERFPLPEQNNRVLEMFMSVKQEMLKSLKSIEGKILGSSTILVVVIHPDIITLRYIVEDNKLEGEIAILLSENMDLSKIAAQILSKDLN